MPFVHSLARLSEYVSKNHLEIGKTVIERRRSLIIITMCIWECAAKEKERERESERWVLHQRIHFSLVEKRGREREKKKRKEKTFRRQLLFHFCSKTFQMISHREFHHSQAYAHRTGRVAMLDALTDDEKEMTVMLRRSNPIGRPRSSSRRQSRGEVTSLFSSRIRPVSSDGVVRVFDLFVADLRATGVESERELFPRLVSQLFGMSDEAAGAMLHSWRWYLLQGRFLQVSHPRRREWRASDRLVQGNSERRALRVARESRPRKSFDAPMNSSIIWIASPVCSAIVHWRRETSSIWSTSRNSSANLITMPWETKVQLSSITVDR